MTFSASIFASIFSLIFDGKWLPNGAQKYMGRRAFWHPFRDLFVYVDFMLNLAHLGLPFGALWLPLGSLWLTFGSLLVPFGSLFGTPVARCSHFWWLLASFFIFCYIFEENLMSNHIFEKITENPIDVWPNVPLPFFRKVVSAVAETRLCRAKDKDMKENAHGQ